MLSKIRFTEGYAVGLDNVGTQPFTFTPGLNILFGPNGCGKSTILKSLKAYCAIPAGGWSTILNPMETGAGSPDDFPDAFGKYCPAQCRAFVTWDGSPTFYNEGNVAMSDTWFFTNQGVMDDGITTEAEQFQMLAASPSSGEFRMSRLNKMLSMIGNPPDLSVVPPHLQIDEQIAADAQAQVDYIASLSRKGPTSILLDEPERALSISKQQALFKVLLDFSEKYQIIAATHSVLSLFLGPRVNVIDLQPGYAHECITTIKTLQTQ